MRKTPRPRRGVRRVLLALAGTLALLGPGLGLGARAGAQEPPAAGEEPLRLEIPKVSTSLPDSEGEPIETSAPEPDAAADAATSGAAGDGDPGALGQTLLDPAEAFVNANRAYEAGAFPRAVELYEAVLEAGAGDGQLYYNLGNAYLRSGQLGRAIASYRRAQALSPRAQDVEANLEFARKSTRSALAPPSPSQLQRTLFFWHYRLSRGELLRLLVLANLVFWIALAVRRRHRASELLRWLSVVALVLGVAVGASLAWRIVSPQRVAVVIPQEISAHSGNDAESVVRFKLQAGAEVRVLARRGDWLRIALPDGLQGWIEARDADLVVY